MLCMHTRYTGYNRLLETSRIAVLCRGRAATDVADRTAELRILYHFNQLDTTVWLWHVGSIRHLDTGASDLWQWWIFRHLPAQNGLFEREMCSAGGSKYPHVQKRPKMWPDGRFWGQIPFYVLCHTLDLLDIDLGDLWQGPILDRTLGPVTCDCLIDWNGTVFMLYFHQSHSMSCLLNWLKPC